MNADKRILRAALSCLFAALCCAGAFIAVPIPGSPVPVVVQNLFVVLAGLLLGPLWGSLSVLLFIFLGCIGFPVFSGGKAGFVVLAGPTGGYLAGYLLAALVAGLVARKRGLLATVLASLSGFVSILAVGVIRLKLLKNVPWEKALALGLLPFVFGDTVKTILAALVAVRLGRFADSLMGREGTNRSV